MPLRIEPVTPDRWDDLVTLVGPNGGMAGCWCMWFRQSQAEFDAKHGEPNRRAMRAIVRDGREPGLLAYDGDTPIGWVSVAPRHEFPRVERSRVTGPIDDEPAWSIVCFYIARGHRGQGVGAALLRAAVRHAASKGARLVEGYPVDPTEKIPNSYAYYGTTSMFRAAGFREAARRGKRPIMRKRVRAVKAASPASKRPAGGGARGGGSPAGTRRRSAASAARRKAAR